MFPKLHIILTSQSQTYYVIFLILVPGWPHRCCHHCSGGLLCPYSTFLLCTPLIGCTVRLPPLVALSLLISLSLLTLIVAVNLVLAFWLYQDPKIQRTILHLSCIRSRQDLIPTSSPHTQDLCSWGRLKLWCNASRLHNPADLLAPPSNCYKEHSLFTINWSS